MHQNNGPHKRKWRNKSIVRCFTLFGELPVDEGLSNVPIVVVMCRIGSDFLPVEMLIPDDLSFGMVIVKGRRWTFSVFSIVHSIISEVKRTIFQTILELVSMINWYDQKSAIIQLLSMSMSVCETNWYLPVNKPVIVPKVDISVNPSHLDNDIDKFLFDV